MSGFKYYEIDNIFPYSASEIKATQFCKIIRKGKDWCAFHDGIYDSILIPIIKCLEFYKKEDSPMTSNTEWKNFIVYYPIVVLNSDIYSIDTHIDKETINNKEFISFTREINSKKIKDKYLVDFVTKDGVQNYIKNYIEPFMNDFANKIKMSI